MTNHVDEGRFEPTVLGAVRRYRGMVVVIVALTTAAAVGYAWFQPPLYRAHATVTVPPSALAEGQESDQYLDSQVLMLRSGDVAARAAEITNAALGDAVVAASDFSGDDPALAITPPQAAQPGAYGSNLIELDFRWPGARVAHVATNAVVQAYDDVRAAALTAQAEATVAGIERAIRDARTRGQLSDLVNQRTKTLVDLEVDLTRHPTVALSPEPREPVNGNLKRSAAAGLVGGAVLGAGMAYARASRRRVIEDRLDAEWIYDAPLIGEVVQGRSARGVGGVDGGAADAGAVASLPVLADPRGALAEEFRFTAGVVDRLRVSGGSPRGVAVVSVNGGVAASGVTANVALALADSGSHVLAIDADPAGGTLTALLVPGEPPAEGLEQVLSGGRSVYGCVVPCPLHRGVAVLGSGAVGMVRRPGSVTSGTVAKMMVEAKAAFDVVLIDCPSPLRVAEAVDLVSGCDATVVVVGAGELVRDHVALRERLHLAGSSVIGYVLLPAGRGGGPVRRLRDRIARRPSRRAGPPAASPPGPGPEPGEQGPPAPVRPPVG